MFEHAALSYIYSIQRSLLSYLVGASQAIVGLKVLCGYSHQYPSVAEPGYILGKTYYVYWFHRLYMYKYLEVVQAEPVSETG